MEEINVVIPKDKLNDFNYIYSKLMDVKLDVLKTISKRTNRQFNELIIEFVPEIKDFNDEYILKKYSIDKNNLINNTVLNIDNKDVSIIQQEKLNDVVSAQPKVVKKIIKKKTSNSPSNSNLIQDNIIDKNQDTKQELSVCEKNTNSMINSIVPIEVNIPDNNEKQNLIDVSIIPKTKKIIIKKQK
jgi:hypothetical protein